MDSQDTANSMAEPASGHGEPMVKPNAPLPSQSSQPRPQGPPLSPRNSINNGPIGVPRPGQPLRRLDSRTSLGPPVASGQFVQLRPYGPPRPSGSSFPPRSPQPGQLPLQNPLYPPNQRFVYSPGIRGPPPQGIQRPPFIGNQQAYQQQQQRSNDPRFQRPDIAPQNGPPRPGQESAFPRQLLRNDSSLSLQRQQLLSNEEIKQPTRPRIVIEKMADINESSADIDKPERYLGRKKSDAREDAEDDDDDDVVMDREKSPRHNDALDGLVNGSKSPLTPRKLDDVSKPIQPEMTAIESKIRDKQDASSRPISSNIVTTTKELADKSMPFLSQSRPSSAMNKEERKEERLTDRPPSSKDIDNATSLAIDDSNDKFDNKTSRPPSTTLVPELTEELKKSSSPSNDALGNIEQSLMTPKSSDNSRSTTPSRLDTSSNAERELKTPSKTPDKSRSSTPAGLEPPGNAESKSPSKTPDKSRSSTPAGLEPPGNAESKSPSKTPDKSRSSTPAGLEPPGNAESKSPSKTPDKSRSSTPAGLEPPGNAESKSPSKTPDKSRSSTPAGLEPPGNTEQESRTPSPDKSRSSTPAELETHGNARPESRMSESRSPDKSRVNTPHGLIETETLETPAKTPDKSRSNTPSEIESSNKEVEPEEASKSPLHEETAEDILRVKSRPASSLNQPNLIVDEVSKSPKSPRSPTASIKLPVLKLDDSSTDEEVKGFDNGQQRSLSSGSARSPSSARSSIESTKQTDTEKKRTSFVEDLAGIKKTEEIADKTPTPTTPTAKTPRAQTPTKSPDEKISRKSASKKAIQNGSGNETQAPTTNGVAESPTKNSPSQSKETDKRSTAGSPIKSPSKSIKSLPRTPDTPSSTAQEKKKVPMNKIQVGAAPSPNLKTIRSKIGSLENASYKPGGGKVKIENRKLDFSKAQPKIAAKNDKYTPSGGDKKIAQVKLQWNAKSKIGSLDNTTYKPGGGDKKIETMKLDFKDKAKPKVGSKENAKHMPGGGTVKSATPPKTPQETKNNIPMQKIDIKAESKIGSLDNVKHKPGGGDKKIFNDRDYLRQTSSNVESLNGSGSQAQTPVEEFANDSRNGDEKPQPQPPPSTPIKGRNVKSPVSVVTPQAVRSELAKSPEVATPGKQLAQETEAPNLINGHVSKTPSPDALSGTPKARSPRSPSSPGVKPGDRSSSGRTSPAASRKTSPGTPSKTLPGTPRKTPSPKELRLPKLASSPTPQEENLTTLETHPKLSLPKLIESSSRMAY